MRGELWRRFLTGTRSQGGFFEITSRQVPGRLRAHCLGASLMAMLVAAGCLSSNRLNSPRQPVADEYYRQRLTDDYRWLEVATNPAVRHWSAAQNARARAWLDRTEARPLVEARLRELFAKTSSDYFDLTWRNGRLFFRKFRPPAQQPGLMVLLGTNDPARAQVVL